MQFVAVARRLIDVAALRLIEANRSSIPSARDNLDIVDQNVAILVTDTARMLPDYEKF